MGLHCRVSTKHSTRPSVSLHELVCCELTYQLSVNKHRDSVSCHLTMHKSMNNIEHGLYDLPTFTLLAISHLISGRGKGVAY